MGTEKERFQEIANVITKNVHGIEKIFLDEFESDGIDYCYLVVVFKKYRYGVGGGLSVRNCRCNSVTANIREVAEMLNGGYYDEVATYNKLKEEVK